MSEIYLIRHGKSKANEAHIFGTDPTLCEIGEQQALNAGPKYKSLNFDKVFCATKMRTKQTAQIVFGSEVPKQLHVPEFNEIWFGDAEGKTDTRTGIQGYTNKYHENFAEFMKECKGDNPYHRATVALDTLIKLSTDMEQNKNDYPNQKIAIVTSDTLMRCIILTWKYGSNWTDITKIKRIENLDALRFTFNNNQLISIEREESSSV